MKCRRDYLRVALTYMLISMPHGTSTIFGVFQAILALLAKPGELSTLTVKLACDAKFASEIFCLICPPGPLVAVQKPMLAIVVPGPAKWKPIKGFAGGFNAAMRQRSLLPG